MRVLIIEDKQKHQESARETLIGHEVVIVTTYDKAIAILESQPDCEETERRVRARGLWQGDKGYWDAYQEEKVATIIQFNFEVVLIDLMMPMSKKTLSSEAYHRGEEVPYGFVLALLAAQAGAKFVAVVTDTNHHQGPMSAALDHLGSAYYQPMAPNFTINGAKCMFVHTPFVEDKIPDQPCTTCKATGVCLLCHGEKQAVPYGENALQACWICGSENNPPTGKCSTCEGRGLATKTVRERKDWGQVLRDLTSEDPVGVATPD